MQVNSRQVEEHIGGVRVKFPFKPYPSQRAMMHKARGKDSVLQIQYNVARNGTCVSDSSPPPDHPGPDPRGERSAGESHWQREEPGPALLHARLAETLGW